MQLLRDRIDSAIGTILLVSDGENLCAVDYAEYEGRMLTLLERHYREFRLQDVTDPQGFSSRIHAYLAGDLSCLNCIPVNPGGTVFQQEVWSALRTIPPGSVLSYGELAARLGRPMSYRAVGMTNALNPVALVIPCHRLVGADGALTGYAGGLDRKRWLLQHEGVGLVELTSGSTVTKDKRTSNSRRLGT
ncbi:MAG: methylated-DNA--[protein]-cysteine S-methyltransferase [Deltaproteobacteria bacterium]|nr:methylated-DNA--[protein]-cysteine S-methyltransferase [Deltaproteobacteria bacterium]